MDRRLFLELLAATTGATIVSPAIAGGRTRREAFVSRGPEGRLELDGKPFRYVGANMPEVTYIRTDWDLEQGNRFRLSTRDEIDWIVEASAQANFKVIRTWCFPSFLQKELSPDLYYFHRNDDGRTVTLNEEGFRLFDYFLARCGELGVRAQIPYIYLPEIKQWADDRGDPHPQLLDLARQLIERVNTITGVAYRDDPAIFAWESGNESRPTARWVAGLAAYVKRLDPNHIFIDGRWGSSDVFKSYSETALRSDTNIDAVSVHTYERRPNGWTTPEAIAKIAALLKGQGKALGVGEISPNSDVAELRDVLEAVVASGASGALWWSFKGARAKGGYTQWNGREWGGNDDLKWPGFVSDLTGVSNEKAKIDLLCGAAYAIEGKSRPAALPAPTPAKLLPISDPGHISWVPGTGEQIADVQRATRRDGPFETVAEGFETFKGSTFALFCDGSAKPGETYFYRVISRNTGGTAAPSNVAEPVRSNERWFVDDLWSLDKTSARSGGCSILSDYDLVPYHADPSVLTAAGDAEYVDYTFAGDLRSLLVISNNDTRTLSIEGASGNGRFEPLTAKRTLYPELHPEFAGHPRVTYRVATPPGHIRRVRIRFGRGDVISRVEASFA